MSSGDWQEIQMRRLSGGHSGTTLVAVGDQGTVIGLGNVFPESPGDEHSAEIALLVEDDHQSRAVGTALLRHLIWMAHRMGFAEVVGVVLADNTGMPHLLEADGRHWNSTIDSGERTMRAELPADHPPPDP